MIRGDRNEDHAGLWELPWKHSMDRLRKLREYVTPLSVSVWVLVLYPFSFCLGPESETPVFLFFCLGLESET